MRVMPRSLLALAPVVALIGTAAQAQDGGERRYRVGLGAQLVPSYPGADSVSVRPLIDVARSSGADPFDFEAPDESFGFRIVEARGLSFGPVLAFEGRRRASEVGGLPTVKASFEGGGFVQYQLSPAFRLRAEVRQGITGHKGLIANVGGDVVARDGDRWLFSVGPRVTLASNKYNAAYFSVSPASSATTGVPAFDADGGVQAVGATAGLITQLTPRFGLYSYAKYDRLVGDAARSPVSRLFGSRNQYSGGLALTYSFTRRR